MQLSPNGVRNRILNVTPVLSHWMYTKSWFDQLIRNDIRKLGTGKNVPRFWKSVQQLKRTHKHKLRCSRLRSTQDSGCTIDGALFCSGREIVYSTYYIRQSTKYVVPGQDVAATASFDQLWVYESYKYVVFYIERSVFQFNHFRWKGNVLEVQMSSNRGRVQRTYIL